MRFVKQEVRRQVVPGCDGEKEEGSQEVAPPHPQGLWEGVSTSARSHGASDVFAIWCSRGVSTLSRWKRSVSVSLYPW